MDKSKIVCFNKLGRQKYKLQLQSRTGEVNYTKPYLYLGIELANSFTFKLAKKY